MSLVSTTTVGAGGVATITFSSIPQTATDLLILLSARATTATNEVYIALNGTSVGISRLLSGDGSSSSSSYYSTGAWVGSVNKPTDAASTFGNSSIYIVDYTSSVNKSLSVDEVQETNATEAYQLLRAMRSTVTTGITSITLTASNFAEYSTASLYTITKGSGGATVS